MKKIKKLYGAWNFKKDVAENFYYHINKSVPLYKEGHQLILKLSDFFLKENSICYDIGCSTSDLLISLKKYTNKKKIKFIGFDIEKEMVKVSKKKIKKLNIRDINVYNKDVTNTKLLKSDLIISYYTIQFINPEKRQNLINKIYKSLNWGGSFIMFEKFRGPDARFQDIFVQIYNDFKESKGFSINEIFNKQKSLRGILEPFSDYGNLSLLKRAGFKDISSLAQFINFKGYICIK
jgi:tRNA (cmo5U34)-methyltransferase